MAFSSVLSLLLSTHSVDCAGPLLLSIHRVNSALFLPFTMLIVPFFVRSPRKLCPFSSVHRTNCALFRWHPALLKTWAEHCHSLDIRSAKFERHKIGRLVHAVNNFATAINSTTETYRNNHCSNHKGQKLRCKLLAKI